MRFVEITAVLGSIRIMLGCMNQLLKWRNFEIEMTDHVREVLDAYNVKDPLCLKDIDTLHDISGRSLEWFAIELTCYCIYILTMTLYMVKSRFISVGINQSTQFEPIYMRYMAQKLIMAIEFHHLDTR